MLGITPLARKISFTTATIAMSSISTRTNSLEKSTYDSEEGQALQGLLCHTHTHTHTQITTIVL